MDFVETLAFLLGLINIALLVRRSVWNYPFGMVMVALYAYLFFVARLYSDALLQIFFFVIQLYGWVAWARARTAADGAVRVARMRPVERVAALIGIALASAAWGLLMHRTTDAALPWWDATVAVASIAAQIMLARRYIENWIVWIAVDVLAIGLYAARGLHLTAGLYLIFLGMSVWGFVAWRRAERATAA